MTNREILSALSEVIDPELGLNIVDLGLVYRADWTACGIAVSITMTSPSCPVRYELADCVESTLRRHFAEARSITVDLVWDPPWSPARMTDAGRYQLGWAQPSEKASSKFATPGAMSATHRWEH
ncbi:MAG: metal-sulfur cluster assembly factor [Rhizobiales bacterium]|nr:metal-sulfur cluster assembly factor [Hyphomicrobiales bacterium]